MSTPTELAGIYIDAWQAGDEDRLRSIMTPDVTFRGPLGTADGVEECLAGLLGMRAHVMKGIDVLKVLADETDVMTWYDLQTDAGPLPTVNWSRIRDGRIAEIRATFDPRPVAPPS